MNIDPFGVELRNCTLPDGRKNMAIRMRDGVITEISDENRWPKFHDLKGLTVFPGVIDVHVHDRTPSPPQAEKAETWDSLSQQALRGGVTYVVKMPNTNPPIIHAEDVDKDWVEVGCQAIPRKIWFGATTSNHQEIRSVVGDPRVAGVKMYMGSSTGDLLVHEESDQRKIFELCSARILTLAVHAEDENLMLENMRLLNGQPLISQHCLIRDTEVEVSAVRRALRLAKETGCKVHLCHISTPESVELAHDAKENEVEVTVGVCPHHLFLDSNRLQRDDGGFYKMNPPLRSVRQLARLRDLVRRPGYVDIIESDHAPHTRAAKEKREYQACPSGVPGLETLLPLMLRFAHENEVSHEHIINLVSRNPALLIGETRKGKVAAGYEADLVALDPEEDFEIRHEDLSAICGWTPYQGWDAVGRPHMVFVGGELAFERKPSP